jgi:thiamine monophosphate kinase
MIEWPVWDLQADFLSAQWSILLRSGGREEFYMSEVSNDDVVAIVGPIGDAAVAEIIGTGISKDELVEAHERAVKDRKAHDPGPPLEPGPFAQVVGILERLRKGGWLSESGSTLT